MTIRLFLLLSIFVLFTSVIITNHDVYADHIPITLQKFTESSSQYGYSIASDGNFVLVGVPFDDDLNGIPDIGSAYLFDATTGSLLKTFTNPTPSANDQFGFSVAISGNKILIGAPLDDTIFSDVGTAYLFDIPSGSLIHTYDNPTPSANDQFGFSVTLSGNNVAIGVKYDDVAGIDDVGSVSLFDATTGLLQRTVNNPTPFNSDFFGSSISLSGNNLLVGAFGDNLGGYAETVSTANTGSAYLFDVSSGLHLRTFDNPTPANQDIFAEQVAISGNYVLVGARWDDTGAANAGSAYLFDATTGSLLKTLVNPTPQIDDNFGFAISVSGNNLIIGAPLDNTGSSDTGSAYLFDATTGSLLKTFANPTPSANDLFGRSVSVSGNNVVIGSPQDDIGAPDTGSAYLFDATTGSLLKTLDKFSVNTNGLFGYSVAISEDYTVIAEDRNDPNAVTDAGSVYIYNSMNGKFIKSIDDPFFAVGDYFGRSVSIFENKVLVGAPGVKVGTTNDAGKVYLFNVETGSLLQTFTNPTPGNGDCFGCAVSISGNNVLVGALGDDTNALNAGSAYLFDATTGSLLFTFNNPTHVSNDYFGHSVDIFGNKIIVGARYEDTGSSAAGSAYIYDAITGFPLHTFHNPFPQADDDFGYSVAVSENYFLIGTPGNNIGTQGTAGSAYLFDATTFDLLHTLDNPTPSTNDAFSWSVDISGNNVLIGVPFDNPTGTAISDAGSAYLFDATTGSLVHTYSNPMPSTGDFFGNSVALYGNTVLVGAPYNTIGTITAGSAYLFLDGTNTSIMSINDISQNEGNSGTTNFVFTVTRSGDTSFTSSVNYNTSDATATAGSDYTSKSGTINFAIGESTKTVSISVNGDNTVESDETFYVNLSNCTLCNIVDNQGVGTILNDDVAIPLEHMSQFGRSASTDGTYVLLGAPLDDNGATNAGSAYLYDANTGSLIKRIDNPSPGVDDNFGYAVSVSGNKALISEYKSPISGHNIGGVVHLFDVSTGLTIHSFTDPGPASTSSGFGSVVLISGNKIFISAPRDTYNSIQNAGAVYVYDATTYSLLHIIGNQGATASNVVHLFGNSISVDGNNLLVGAPGFPNNGIAYLYDVTSGNLVKTIPRTAGNLFGLSVAISGNNILIASELGTRPNSHINAYLIDATTGSLLHTFTDPNNGGSDYRAANVALSGNNAIVSYPQDDTGFTNSGIVYLYDATTGALLHTFNNPTPNVGEYFGFPATISGNQVLINSFIDNSFAGSLGSAFIFDATTGSLTHTFRNPTKIIPEDLGSVLGITSDYVVTGGIRTDAGGKDSGVVYLYDTNTGNLINNFNNPNPNSGTQSNFGISTDVSGDKLVVHSGSALWFYSFSTAVYDLTTGNVISQFTPQGAITGGSVSISGNNILVGATGFNPGGIAHLYDANTGTLIRSFNNPGSAHSGDNFGFSVDLSGNNALIGAPLDDTDGINTGIVHLFDTDTGLKLQTFHSPTLYPVSRFGTSIALSGNNVLVGAHDDNSDSHHTGVVYLFDANTGSLIQTFHNPVADRDTNFGFSVAISNNEVLIGAPDNDISNGGAAYLFDLTTGSLVHKFKNPTINGSDKFGNSVAIYGDNIVIGAPGDDTFGPNSGNVFFFKDTYPRTFAGPDQTIPENYLVTLSGTATDPNGNALTYSWTQTSGPAVTLSSTTTPIATFTAPDIGPGPATLVFSLTASNGVDSSTDSVSITVTDTDTPPTIIIPSDIVAEATSSSGALVNYMVTATDVPDGTITPQCSPTSGSTFTIGTTIITCTATDSSGNTSTESFSITVQDTTKPEVSFVSLTPSIVGGSSEVEITKIASDAVGIDTITATISGPSPSTDIIGTVSLSLTSGTAQSGTWSGTFTFQSSNITPDGTYTVDEIVTDTSFNSLSMNDGLVTLDRTAPTTSIISISPSFLRPTDLVTITASASDTLSGVSSITAQDLTINNIPISLALVSGSTEPGQIGTFQGFITGELPEGLHEILVSTKDNAVTPNENIITVQDAFTMDSTSPILDIPSDILLEATSYSGATVQYAVTSSDNIDTDVLITCDVSSGTELPFGNTLITCTAFDDAGNTSTGSFTVTVVDTTSPTLTIPSDITAEATSSSGATVSYTATASDSVDGDLIPTCTPPSDSIFPLGSTTVECTVSDAAGNTSTGSFTVTVVDTTSPTLTIPSDITAEATSSSGATVSYTATASDSVDGDLIPTCTPPSDSIFPLGSTTVECTVSDAAGNTSTGSSTINVIDNTPPSIQTNILLIGDVTASGATVSYTATASDSVDGDLIPTCTPPSDSIFPLGSTTVECTVSDAAGNIATTTFFVTIFDNNAPTIMLPSDITAEATSSSGATVSYTATASDSVDGDLIPTCTPPSDSIFPLGSTTVECTVSDAAGNTSTGSFTVTVVDTTSPTLTIPSDITAEATSSSGATVSYTATASDSVDGDVSISCTPVSGNVFGLGSTTVSCSSTDSHGNTNTASFGVNVVDTTNPVLQLPSDITAEATSSSGAPVTYSTTAADVVDGTLTPTCTPISGSIFALGSTIISCSVTDSSSNTSSGSFTITVVDTTSPDTAISSALDGASAPVTNGGTTTSNSITFAFAGTDNVGVTGFQCSLDGGAFASCTSPVTYTGLSVSSHTFNVKAIDGATNSDATPATFGWAVSSDLTPTQKIQNIIDQVQNLVNNGTLNKGQGNSLIVKLDNIIKSLDKGNTDTTINQLNAFVNEANALIKSKGLSSQLQPLVDQAISIINQLS